MTTYTQEIINHFYDINLKDRIRFLEVLEEKYKYAYDISTRTYEWFSTKNDCTRISEILFLTKMMSKCQNAKEFFESLSLEQRKEIQTQIYLKSRYIKTGIEEPYPKVYSSVSKYEFERIRNGLEFKEEPYDKYQTKEFSIEFEKLEAELNNCLDSNGYNALNIINCVDDFIHRYSECTFEFKNQKLADKTKKEYIERYIKPLNAEYNYSKKIFDDELHKNINETTIELYDSLSSKEQFFIIMTILNIDMQDIDRMIAYRKKLRNDKKENNEEKPVKKNKVYMRTRINKVH